MVKYNDKTSVSRLEATRQALFLAYGSEEPSRKDPPPRLLTYRRVAELMRVRPHFICYLMRLYFEPSDATA